MLTPYRPRGSSLLLILTILTLGVSMGLPMMAGCGANARQTTIRASLGTLQTARTAFEIWDDRHQQEIVDQATSLEDGKQKLEAYRAKRQVALKAFVAAVLLLAHAANEKDDPSLDSAKKAISDLIRQLGDLGVSKV